MKKTVIIILGILLIGGGVFTGVKYVLDMNRASEIYGETGDRFTDYGKSSKSVIVVNEPESESETEELIADSAKEVLEEDIVDEDEGKDDSIVYSYRYDGPWESQVDVNLVNLQMLYPDVKGWLFFENEDISYPIMQSATDEKYLKTTYNGERNSAGSIFMEALNMPDFSDTHIIIYGHNMKNRTMFGALRNYVNHSKYYDYHKYFQIIRLDENGNYVKSRYKIFAYGKTKSYSKIYTVCRKNDADFLEVIQYIQGNSTVTTDVPVYETDSVVTLSTCSIGENRLAVSGVKVEEIIVQ